jgi:predicted ATPase
LLDGERVFDASGQFRTDIAIDEIDVPENVRLIIGRRLERLSKNEKRVLTAAAVIGRSFSFQLLTAISEVDVDDLFRRSREGPADGNYHPEFRGAREAIYLRP